MKHKEHDFANGKVVDNHKEHDFAAAAKVFDNYIATLHKPGGHAIEDDYEKMKSVTKARETLLKSSIEYQNKCNELNIPLYDEFDAEIIDFEDLHVNLNDAFEEAVNKEVTKATEVEPQVEAGLGLQQYTTQEADGYEAEESDMDEGEELDPDWVFSDERSDDGMSDYRTDEDLEDMKIRDNEGSSSECDSGPDDLYLSEQLMRAERGLEVEGGQKLRLQVGDIFEDIKALRAAIKDICIQDQFEVIRLKNEKARVTMKCKAEGCAWSLHARPLEDEVTFSIRRLGEDHNCMRVKNEREATSKWMAKKMVDILRANPEISNHCLLKEMEKYNLEPSYMKLWRARVLAVEMIQGKWADSYAKLPHYVEMVKKYNPGSTVELVLEEIQNVIPPNEMVGEGTDREGPMQLPTTSLIFKRIFMGLNAVKKGFLAGCQAFVGFDGTHLKSPYKGIVLSAISLDVNNGLFPIAVAVVEIESQETWGWFFDQLSVHLGGFTPDRPWTIQSDRQKGLVESVKEMFPHVIHRKCARHIFANYRKKFKGPVCVRYFWMAARAYTLYDFNYAMWILKEKKYAAWEWLNEIPEEQWSRHAFPTLLKNDHITNNFVESFNNWIGSLRDKPILILLEGIRTKMMNRMHRRYEKSTKWQQKTSPYVVEKLNAIILDAPKCEMGSCIGTVFEIGDEGVHYEVDLVARKCDCGFWELTGIPCKHAVKAINFLRGKPEDYVDSCWSMDQYKKAYAYEIKPIKHWRFWPPQTTEPKTIGPPIVRKQPGRPKKLRNRETDESGPQKRINTIKCQKCSKFGHNQRSCLRRQQEKTRKDKAAAKYKRVADQRRAAAKRKAKRDETEARKKAKIDENNASTSANSKKTTARKTRSVKGKATAKANEQ